MKLGATAMDDAYVIFDNPTLDGKQLPLRDAIEAIHRHMFGSVVCTSSSALAYHEPEFLGKGTSYVLSPQVDKIERWA